MHLKRTSDTKSGVELDPGRFCSHLGGRKDIGDS